MDIETNRNEIVETPFDLQDKIGEQGLGAFILIAEYVVEGEPEYRRARALRWLISTDLALTSYHGSDGLYLSVRSIKNAQLKPGVRLDLIASNNEKLSEVTTDREGRAIFEQSLLAGTGPAEPRMIMAYGADGDYAVLDLSRAPLDLSTLDVQGRDVAGEFDLYSFTDRGIYRPGETVQLTTLLRDSHAVAVEDRVLKIVVKRPDGSQQSSRILEDSKMGGFAAQIDLPAQAARGKWSLEIGVEGTDVTIEKSISVEDFVPQRLKLSLSPEQQDVLTTGDVREITLDAQFYYGAPGSNLETEAELRIQKDPNPFPDFKGYNFGDVTETFRESNTDLTIPMTDDEGKSTAKLSLQKTDVDSSFPLRASFIAGVSEPGGRYVRENIFIPVRKQSSYIGFKSKFGDRAERRNPAGIELVALSSAGERIASDVDWTLYREESLDAKERQGVKRAVGLTHVALDRSSQTLNVALDIPDRVEPRNTLDVPVSINGAASLKKAWVSLAAVDEGILALTDFDSPDAPAAFFAKKAFALDIHDDYSRMLNPYQAGGPSRSGGDSIGGAGLSVVPTKTIALYEGPVSLNNGKATIILG